MNWLSLAGLFAAAFTLATLLEPAFRQWSRRKGTPASVLESLMGDSRRLFANHFFIQSDVYLHRGYYPTIFDNQEQASNTVARLTGQPQEPEPDHDHDHDHDHDDPDHKHDEHCAHDFLGKPRNWIDAFGRNFFPAKHSHLGEGESETASAREILPWIRLAAELDPERVETYTVAAYWLRQMGKPDEAVSFLREGLRKRPDSHEILYELGVSYENRKDTERARNLWELALRRWQENEAHTEKPNKLALAEILTHLVRLEVREEHRPVAVKYLELLKSISPKPGEIQKRIDEVKAGQPFENTTPR